jgi:nitrite reductase/ring-hydroxylating ferredoxin subunit
VVSQGFVDVCASSEVHEGQACVAQAEGRTLALARIEGRVYAVDNVCPHHGAEMGRGDLDGYFLSCPWHAWCFDMRDGSAFFPRGARLESFEVQEQSGRVLVRRRRP